MSQIFEYCVIKNAKSIKMFEIIDACLSETLCNGKKPISDLNSIEKILLEIHIFLPRDKKKLLFIPQCYYLNMKS